jgi:cytochrome c biogenesis protein ResB
VRRLLPLRWRNCGFLLSHIGMWMVLAGMSFGNGDLVKIKAILEESQAVTFGFDAEDSELSLPVRLPFALTLKKFVLEEYATDERQPKLFRSELLVGSGAEQRKAVIEVNRPWSIDGWKMYQSGYGPKAGSDSKISIVELVRDPWLPVVYVGLFMILGGVLDLLFRGLRRHEQELVK